jgi:hypothetical protein
MISRTSAFPIWTKLLAGEYGDLGVLGVFGDFALDAWGDFEDFGDFGDLLVLALGDFDEGLTGELVEGDGLSRFRMSTVREGERARVITGLGDARGLAGM